MKQSFLVPGLRLPKLSDIQVPVLLRRIKHYAKIKMFWGEVAHPKRDRKNREKRDRDNIQQHNLPRANSRPENFVAGKKKRTIVFVLGVYQGNLKKKRLPLQIR